MSAVSEHGALRPEDLGRVHLVGVGGAGMSTVAALLAARGVPVSGSDARESPVLQALRTAGVDARSGHDASRVAHADTVVVSSAIRPTNPELVAARADGLRVLHRSQALAALMQGRRAVAVAGAHGKTTTSAMTAVLLGAVGLEPTYAIGGTVLHVDPDAAGGPGGVRAADDLVGGARHGVGEVFVAEADESDGSFLAYRPTVAVVTNVEPDHLDHYGSTAAFEAAFVQFVDRVEPEGWLVACLDDPGSAALAAHARAAGRKVVTYGASEGADVQLAGWAPVVEGPMVGRAVLVPRTGSPVGGGAPVDLVLRVPGLHNALNATAAWTVGMLLGADAATAAAALGTFGGTGRRFEDRGTAGGVRVVDDYAHHPTEVAALLRAARSSTRGRVLVLFQPHLYSRTRTFAAEFAAALQLADQVVVTDVYAAREDHDPTVTGATVTDLMDGRARFVPDRVEAARAVAALASSGDLVLTVGAGDVTELAPVVLEGLGG